MNYSYLIPLSLSLLVLSGSVHSDNSVDFSEYHGYLWKKIQTFSRDPYLTPDAPSETIVEEELTRWPVSRTHLNAVLRRTADLTQFISLLEERDDSVPG